MAPRPSRGEIWRIDLEPVRGHEQGRTRPCLIVSHDIFNHGPAGLVVVVPLTRTDRGVPLHVPIDPPEGGVRERSFIKCEDIRALAIERVLDRWGTLSPDAMHEVEDRLRILLRL